MKLKIVLCIMVTMMNIQAYAQQEVKTVAFVSVDRYVGKWYEVARFPNQFQTKCTGDVTAEYQKRDDGRLGVVNRCRMEGRKFEQVAGVARIVDTDSNAKLKVRFAPAWLGWLPQVWGDYWIVGLAQDYSYAVVGDPRREYLWVLSRTPNMPEESYQAAVRQAGEQSFDVTKLVRTKHEM
jgi:apolipoprotein D and lipocalin family protein